MTYTVRHDTGGFVAGIAIRLDDGTTVDVTERGVNVEAGTPSKIVDSVRTVFPGRLLIDFPSDRQTYVRTVER